jgi:hypothetical protein
MKGAVVVDTNVPVVANDRTEDADPDCVIASIDALSRIRDACVVLLDEGGLILEEYRRHLAPAGQPGPGDAFFKWLWNNQGYSDRCRRVAIAATADGRSFEEFPDDPELAGFDEDDRKFAATAVAYPGNATVVVATDRDWWDHRKVLERNRIRIRFLCPELMA